MSSIGAKKSPFSIEALSPPIPAKAMAVMKEKLNRNVAEAG